MAELEYEIEPSLTFPEGEEHNSDKSEISDDEEGDSNIDSDSEIVYVDDPIVNDEIDEDTDDDDDYLQKFDAELTNNYVANTHPETAVHNYDEVSILTKVVRNEENIITDGLHRTIPYLTKYEKTRIIGARAKQLNEGSRPFIKVKEHVIDGYLIAQQELEEKKIPFIIRRPVPGGGSEYWNLTDLEII